MPTMDPRASCEVPVARGSSSVPGTAREPLARRIVKHDQPPRSGLPAVGTIAKDSAGKLGRITAYGLPGAAVVYLRPMDGGAEWNAHPDTVTPLVGLLGREARNER